MTISRIPAFNDKSFDGMQHWFAELAVRRLIFHPDDSPSDILSMRDNNPLFTPRECTELEEVLAAMFETFGDEVYEAVYPVFMKAAGQRLDS